MQLATANHSAALGAVIHLISWQRIAGCPSHGSADICYLHSVSVHEIKNQLASIYSQGLSGPLQHMPALIFYTKWVSGNLQALEVETTARCICWTSRHLKPWTVSPWTRLSKAAASAQHASQMTPPTMWHSALPTSCQKSLSPPRSAYFSCCSCDYAAFTAGYKSLR